MGGNPESPRIVDPSEVTVLPPFVFDSQKYGESLAIAVEAAGIMHPDLDGAEVERMGSSAALTDVFREIGKVVK